MAVLNSDLKSHNTFGVSAQAKAIHAIHTESELIAFLAADTLNTDLILGQGSNVLFTDHLPYRVGLLKLKGRHFKVFSEDEVLVTAAAGEPWHDFVMWTLEQGFGGLENLALIPGSVGASPIQNIGAYGVELKDRFYSCRAIDRSTKEEKVFNHEDCAFGYRNSIFKNEYKNRFVIVEVTFKLSRRNHKLNLNYAPLKKWFLDKNIEKLRPIDVAEAVCSIRRSKLPDPTILGNAGSFFKNPIITAEFTQSLLKKFPEAPLYSQPDGTSKIAAGWLIDQLGLKGYRQGDAAVHDKQALVLVNLGAASGNDLKNLAQHIKKSVNETFGITLEEEVTFYP
jgi:UDP-N-acetylmuramate dehydrogenase